MPTVYHLSKYVIHLGVAKQAHLMLIGDVGKYRIEEEEKKKKACQQKPKQPPKQKALYLNIVVPMNNLRDS